MAGNVNPDVLQQRWIHSHEEDTDTDTVYRPADYPFPPSRGRAGFELKPDGSLVQVGIGPTDRREETPGKWKLEDDDQLALYTGDASAPSQVLKIASANKDRLVVKK